MARVNDETRDVNKFLEQPYLDDERPPRSDLVIESDDQRFIRGFRVVVEREVGIVMFGEGDMSPREAAFRMIGATGEEGAFRFPNEDQGHVIVEVRHDA